MSLFGSDISKRNAAAGRLTSRAFKSVEGRESAQKNFEDVILERWKRINISDRIAHPLIGVWNAPGTGKSVILEEIGSKWFPNLMRKLDSELLTWTILVTFGNGTGLSEDERSPEKIEATLCYRILLDAFDISENKRSAYQKHLSTIGKTQIRLPDVINFLKEFANQKLTVDGEKEKKLAILICVDEVSKLLQGSSLNMGMPAGEQLLMKALLEALGIQQCHGDQNSRIVHFFAAATAGVALQEPMDALRKSTYQVKNLPVVPLAFKQACKLVGDNWDLAEGWEKLPKYCNARVLLADLGGWPRAIQFLADQNRQRWDGPYYNHIRRELDAFMTHKYGLPSSIMSQEIWRKVMKAIVLQTPIDSSSTLMWSNLQQYGIVSLNENPLNPDTYLANAPGILFRRLLKNYCEKENRFCLELILLHTFLPQNWSDWERWLAGYLFVKIALMADGNDEIPLKALFAGTISKDLECLSIKVSELPSFYQISGKNLHLEEPVLSLNERKLPTGDKFNGHALIMGAGSAVDAVIYRLPLTNGKRLTIGLQAKFDLTNAMDSRTVAKEWNKCEEKLREGGHERELFCLGIVSVAQFKELSLDSLILMSKEQRTERKAKKEEKMNEKKETKNTTKKAKDQQLQVITPFSGFVIHGDEINNFISHQLSQVIIHWRNTPKSVASSMQE